MSQGKTALSIVRKYHPQVNKIVEAKKDLNVNVTKSDCKKATSKAPSSCAMAKACQRDFDGAIISLSSAYVIKGDVATRYKVPQSVVREIVSFDRNHDFAPGDYKLKAPSKLQKLATYRAYQAKKLRDDPNYRKYRNSTEYKRAHSADRPRSHKTAGIRAL